MNLEQRYRRALRWYPRSWRREHEDALIGLMLDQADAEGRLRIARRTSASLAWQGIRQRLAQVFIGVPVLVLALMPVVAFVALWVGLYPFGNSYEDHATCLMSYALPAHDPLVVDTVTQATAVHTWIPLGFVCTVDDRGDGLAPQVIPHQNWGATAVWLGSTSAWTIALGLLSVRLLPAIRRLRVRPTMTDPPGRA